MEKTKYWIEKSLITGMPLGVEKCDFRPTIHPHQNTEWIETTQADPAFDALVLEMVEACRAFKKGFDNGFSNSLNTIEARDAILESVVKYDAYVRGSGK